MTDKNDTETAEKSGVDSSDLFAENVKLREALQRLLDLYDGFKDEATYENAYYSFYKGQYDKWEDARNLLANKEDLTLG